MPYPVLAARWIAPNVRWLRARAPHVTHNCKPGQFVILRPAPSGERIPLTVARTHRAAGEIELIVQVVGATTADLAAIEAGQSIPDIAGPLGKPTEIHDVGHAVLVGGGVGTAVIYPQARALREAGNRVTAIIGARSKPFILLEEELKGICEKVHPCTDDGSYGFHGWVTDRLKLVLNDTRYSVGVVICAGPVPMMRSVADVTRPLGIKTIASLNPIMVDGTGMCGGCRVRAGGQVQFACVDGPEFDAHTVDFGELAGRLTAYRDHEKQAMEHHTCQVGSK